MGVEMRWQCHQDLKFQFNSRRVWLGPQGEQQRCQLHQIRGKYLCFKEPCRALTGDPFLHLRWHPVAMECTVPLCNLPEGVVWAWSNQLLICEKTSRSPHRLLVSVFNLLSLSFSTITIINQTNTSNILNMCEVVLIHTMKMMPVWTCMRMVLLRAIIANPCGRSACIIGHQHQLSDLMYGQSSEMLVCRHSSVLAVLSTRLHVRCHYTDDIDVSVVCGIWILGTEDGRAIKNVCSKGLTVVVVRRCVA